MGICPKRGAKITAGHFGRDPTTRRVLAIELPEFLIYALEARVSELNSGAHSREHCSVANLIESELVSLVSVRDIAALECTTPGFAHAVQQWLLELRE
jgi:hypothetical protein